MPPIRVMIQNNRKEIEALVPSLNKRAAETRQAPGCLQCEFFRSSDIHENLLHLELWESIGALDSYWSAHPDQAFALGAPHLLQSPFHWGSPELPRRHGQNGVEFYRYTLFDRQEDAWVPVDRTQLPETFRWPSWGGVRIINQSTSDPNNEGDRTRYIMDTRAEPGCIQFEVFRSVEFPQHTVNLELWEETPRVYDFHYLNRILQRQWGTLTRPVVSGEPPARAYGENGFEFYQSGYHALVDGVWQPENEPQRMVTVRWP